MRESLTAKFSLTLLQPLLIVLLGGMAYAGSFRGSFVLDDSRTVVGNMRIRRLMPKDANGWLERRAFGNLTFALNYATGKLNPADYHAANLLIHLAAALALYGVVRRTLALPRSPRRYKHRAAPLAFWVAAVWVVHPLTTSAVTYISQRYESLMALFYLLTLYGVIRGAGGAHGRWWYVLSIVACLLGMATKEVIVTVPAVVLAYDRIFLSRSFREAFARRGVLYAGLLTSWVLLAAMAMFGSEAGAISGRLVDTASAPQYALTQCGVIARYLRLAVAPYGLCLDYDWPLVEKAWEAFPSVIMMGLLGLATVGALWRMPRLGFLGFAFFVILSPTSSIAPRPDCAFEHRMYLPLAAVMAAVVFCFYEVAERLHRRRAPAVAAVLAGVAVVLLAGMTRFRNRAYLSEEAVWQDVLTQYPNHLRAYQNLASLAYEKAHYGDALAFCGEIFKRVPDFAALGRSELLATEGTPRGARLFRQAFQWTLAMNTAGLCLRAQDRLEEARRSFETALRIAPGNLRAAHNLAACLFRLGRSEAAIAQWRKLLKRRPDDPDIHRALGEASLAGGDTATAVAYYDRTLEIDPDNVVVQSRLAWILATAPDPRLRNGARAVALAEQTARATGNAGSCVLGVLAAAYAEAGRFEDAVEIAGKALRLAEQPRAADEMKARLDLYARGKVYRDEELGCPRPVAPEAAPVPETGGAGEGELR